MQHKYLGNLQCPIARSLERVGEWWSILILRDAFLGSTRFDQFQKSLGIAPNMLTRRLNTLVDSGLLERRLYSDRPPRYEYVLTPRGHDFRPVLWALLAWGNKHFAPEGESVIVVDAQTGERVEPILVDKLTGRPMRPPEFAIAAGPAANERTRQRYAKRHGDAALLGSEPDSAGGTQPTRDPAAGSGSEPGSDRAAGPDKEPARDRAAPSSFNSPARNLTAGLGSPGGQVRKKTAVATRPAALRRKGHSKRNKVGVGS